MVATKVDRVSNSRLSLAKGVLQAGRHTAACSKYAKNLSLATTVKLSVTFGDWCCITNALYYSCSIGHGFRGHFDSKGNYGI